MHTSTSLLGFKIKAANAHLVSVGFLDFKNLTSNFAFLADSSKHKIECFRLNNQSLRMQIMAIRVEDLWALDVVNHCRQ